MADPIIDRNGTTQIFDVSGDIRIIKKGPPIVALPPLAIGTALLFIPQAVTLADQVPMLVYYHGHHGPQSIEGYVNELKERDFRPLLRSTKVLLVEPQGGPLSRFGQLGTPAGLTRLIDQAMSTALRLGPPGRRMPDPIPKPSSLILAGFSGGGAALNNVVLDVKADYISRLSEVWCFDSMYSFEGKKWVDWVRQAGNSKRQLRVRVSTEEANGRPGAQARVINQALTWAGEIDVEEPVESTHEGLPSKFIADWL